MADYLGGCAPLPDLIPADVQKRRFNRRFSLVLLSAAVLYLAVGYFFSSLIIAPSPRRSVQASHQALLEGWGYDQDSLLRELSTPREVDFPGSTPDVTLRAWLFDGRPGADCGIVMAHGITENRANVLKYLHLFEDCGCAMLAFDHRGHGTSGGEQLTGSYFESRDVLAAQRYLAAEKGLDPRQIAFVGESWGAAAVLVAASQTDSVAFVLADSPYASWRDAIVQRGDKQFGKWVRFFLPGAFLWTRLRTGARPREASPIRFAPQITRPTLLIHGVGDTVTPYTHSERIAAEMDPAVGHVEVLDWGAWHAHNALARPGDYYAIVEAYFRQRGAWLCAPVTEVPDASIFQPTNTH